MYSIIYAILHLIIHTLYALLVIILYDVNLNQTHYNRIPLIHK